MHAGLARSGSCKEGAILNIGGKYKHAMTSLWGAARDGGTVSPSMPERHMYNTIGFYDTLAL